MKTKVQKKEELGKLKTKLPQSTITIFTTFAREGQKGLSVAQMQELKRALRQLHAEYLIAKKSLTDILVKEMNYDGVDVYKMAGSLGIVVGSDDGYAVAKKIYEFAKKNEALQLFGAYFDGKFMDADQFVEMAKLPSRNELIARLLGMFKYPLSSLAIVLRQIGEEKEKTALLQASEGERSAQGQQAAGTVPVDTPVVESTESTNQ
jgi:large subunit ribosomal protein L10